MFGKGKATGNPCGDGMHRRDDILVPIIFADRVEFLLVMLHIVTKDIRHCLKELLHLPPMRVFVMQKLIANLFDTTLVDNRFVSTYS